jgi:hypothetical protein
MRGNVRDLAAVNEAREAVLGKERALDRVGAKALELLRRSVVAAGAVEEDNPDEPLLTEARAIVAEADALNPAA